MNYLDSRNYSIPFKWLVLHILLGITVVYSHTVAQLWGIVALVVGIGLILKIRFPVVLKLITCKTTDNASTIYIIPTSTNITGLPIPNAKAVTAPPKNMEPVSPINTLAG